MISIRMRFLALLLILCLPLQIVAQNRMPDAPNRNEGVGPFKKMIIRGVTMIDGTGSPALGPVDIVVEGNKITQIRTIGYPGIPVQERGRPDTAGAHVIHADGMYIMPGLVDMHAHTGGNAQGTTPEYVYKLWMAHGITTVREPGSFNGMDWTLRHKARSAKNEITAPRIKAFIGFGNGSRTRILTAEDARKWVRMIHKEGADGIKFFGAAPEVYKAALDEAKKLGLGTTTHHAQTRVTYSNALESARNGLQSMEHWYGLPEALFVDRRIQDYPADYNYQNEQHRFEQAGKLWKQAAPRGSERWNNVIEELIQLDFTINPTLTIYEASRDLMKETRAEWHERYTLPSLWEFFKPNRISHGSYWFNWGTEQEVAWKENYQIWMSFINDYKNQGGRVTTGSDAGYIYKLYGFGLIRELELLREAGFHPLEVVQAATIKGAEVLGMDKEIGTIELGKLADLLIVDANPLENFKVLYGTGAIYVNEDNQPVRIGGVKWTIKDGIIYDAKKLLKDVEDMVAKKKEETGYSIKQPGLDW